MFIPLYLVSIYFVILSIMALQSQKSGIKAFAIPTNWYQSQIPKSLKSLSTFLMKMTSNMVQPQIPRLTKENYENQHIQMKLLFGSQELWELVTNKYVE